jgi:hypothetical protein
MPIMMAAIAPRTMCHFGINSNCRLGQILLEDATVLWLLLFFMVKSLHFPKKEKNQGPKSFIEYLLTIKGAYHIRCFSILRISCAAA